MNRQYGAVALLLTAALLLAIYVAVASIPNLPRQAPAFVFAWLAAAIVHAAATVLLLRAGIPGRTGLIIVFAAAALFRLVMVPAAATSSDDVYRYVWDGKVQAAGINPYVYPPDSPQLAALRDGDIWPNINRKSSPTIYPPAAQTAFALIYRLHPDSITVTKLAVAGIDLLAGAAIAATLALAGRSPLLAAVYLWHPLPVIEFAGAGHLDPLFILPLALALLARLRGKSGLSGGLMAVAVLVKFIPAVVFAAVWRARDWRLPAVFSAVAVALYVPFLSAGTGVIGFLPTYFGEEEYVSGGRYFFYRLLFAALPPAAWTILVVAALGALSISFLRRPANDSPEILRRASSLAFLAMLLVTPSFPWYYGWLLVFSAFDPRPWKLWLTGTVVFAYAWWWLPDGIGMLPGPGHWIYLPAVLLLLFQERRKLATLLRNGRDWVFVRGVSGEQQSAGRGLNEPAR